jgi:hypothetical protein
MRKYLPTISFLRSLLRYDPDTGKLFWRERTPDMFSGNGNGGSVTSCRIWNTRFANKEALACDSGHGYLVGVIQGSPFYAHRVAWAIHYGAWPKREIDHINGDRSDNRIKNLRDVSRSLNGKNVKMYTRNTSGHTGVSWDQVNKKWRVQIVIDGKDRCLGRFESVEDAIAVRKAAEVKHGYTERHGK